MATSGDCGCSGSSSSPPGTTSPTVNAPVGSTTAFGGTARIPRGPCNPAPCPAPPVSDAEERAPYCPTWANSLTASAFGRILLSISGCLYTLKSKCSGFLRYDAATEQVTVENPPFVSSDPKATNFGFLAKVVPTPTTICVDGVDTCDEEIRQEVAAQIVDEASCGRLLLAYPPICGDVPPADSADLQKQIHVSYLEAPLHEDVGCPTEVRFLVRYSGTRGSGGNKTECDQFAWMRRLKLRGSDWGMLEEDDPVGLTGYLPILIPVSGGDTLDPCFELRMSAQKLSGAVQKGEANCDILIYKDVGLATEGYKAVGGALGPQWIVAQTLVFGVNTPLTDYALYAAKGCKLSAIVEGTCIVDGTSGEGGTLVYSANGCILLAVSMENGISDAAGGQCLCPLVGNTLLINRTGSMSGTINDSFRLRGYFVS